MSLGPHSLGLHPVSVDLNLGDRSAEQVKLGLGSHIHGQRTRYNARTSETGNGYHIKDERSTGDGSGHASMNVHHGIARRASLKLRESVDRSRFEFKAVVASKGRGGRNGPVDGVGGLKGWLGGRSRGRSKDRVGTRDGSTSR